MEAGLLVWAKLRFCCWEVRTEGSTSVASGSVSRRSREPSCGAPLFVLFTRARGEGAGGGRVGRPVSPTASRRAGPSLEWLWLGAQCCAWTRAEHVSRIPHARLSTPPSPPWMEMLPPLCAVPSPPRLSHTRRFPGDLAVGRFPTSRGDSRLLWHRRQTHGRGHQRLPCRREERPPFSPLCAHLSCFPSGETREEKRETREKTREMRGENGPALLGFRACPRAPTPAVPV